MDAMMIKARIHANNFMNRVKDFMKEEKGGAEIVATIVLVAIVVLLAVAFKDQLVGLVQGVWNGIDSQATVINESIDLTP